MTLEEFKNLTRDKKYEYLVSIIFPIVKKNHKEREMEIFLHKAKEEDLVEFYLTLNNPEKIKGYIENKNKKIKKNLNELKHIKNMFTKAKIDLKESTNDENNNIERILDNI